MKKVYYYDRITYNYIGEGSANLDPVATSIEGKEVYAKPKYSTFSMPPKTGKGEAAVFDINKDAWRIVKSNKGSYKVNCVNGEVSLITNNEPLRSYECLIPDELLEDFRENPIKYDVIDGKLIDISKVHKYKDKYDMRRYEKLIHEAKEAYVIFRDTPVDYRGRKYLPRYVDDYNNLLNRTFPMEIWEADGINSSIMSKAELTELKNFLEDLDNAAYALKKRTIKKCKLEIEKLGGNNG